MRFPSGLKIGSRRAFLPRDVTGRYPLIFWLPAGGIINNAGVITAAWKDISGRGNDGTPINSPVYTAAAINGFPAASFTAASSQRFSFPNAFGSLTSAEIFIVCKSTATNVGLHNFGNSAGTQELYPFSDNHIYDNFASNARSDCGTPVTSLAAYHVYNARSSGSEYTVFLNNTQQFTTATNTVAWGSGPCIGGSTGSGGATPTTFLTGGVVEAFMFGGILDTATRTRLKSTYLRWKFNLT